MPSRTLRFSLAGFCLVFFGLLVPVHQRGQFALPGVSASASCCGPRGGESHGPAKPAPCKKNQACAVCFFVAAIDVPPAFAWDVPRLDLIEILAARRGEVPPRADRPDAHSARGPPSTSASSRDFIV